MTKTAIKPAGTSDQSYIKMLKDFFEGVAQLTLFTLRFSEKQ
jgi:hypothetical protein